MWTDEHARLVAETRPDAPVATQQELDRVWSRVREGLPAATPPRRRRRRAFIAAGVAAVAVASGAAAVADVISAHTGRYAVDAEDRRLGGPGERLDPAASDYGEVIDEITADVPFPDDASRVIARDEEVGSHRGEAPGTAAVSTGAVRFWTARAAVCAWANEWVVASGARDAAATAHAAAMLQEAPDWPAVTDLDPRQTIDRRWMRSTDAETGEDTSSWVMDNTPAGYFPLVREAAADGDRTELGAVLARWGACAPELVSDFPQALSPR
jgi:hypothetical protein